MLHFAKACAETRAGDADAGPPRYYNFMLSLFALGWADKHYRFREDGTLKLSWETACTRTTAR